MIAAIRVRGDVDVRQKVSYTLENLKLNERNQCVIFEDNDSIKGMLNLSKDYITYGEISKEVIEKLSERKGEEIEHGDVINLSPPTGGFEDLKRQVGQGGTLGKRENMDELVQKMV